MSWYTAYAAQTVCSVLCFACEWKLGDFLLLTFLDVWWTISDWFSGDGIFLLGFWPTLHVSELKLKSLPGDSRSIVPTLRRCFLLALGTRVCWIHGVVKQDRKQAQNLISRQCSKTPGTHLETVLSHLCFLASQSQLNYNVCIRGAENFKAWSSRDMSQTRDCVKPSCLVVTQ